ncbi:MAG: hypothetical protein RLZZ464_1207 [Pseudomonadota bacterium]
MFDPCIAHQDSTPQVIDLRGFFFLERLYNFGSDKMDKTSISVANSKIDNHEALA